MLIETMECRRLLTATLPQGSDVLTITGTENSEQITVSLQGDEIVVNERPTFYIFRRVFGQNVPRPVTTRFDAADVASIVVNAGAGNDAVYLTRGVDVPATIDGGNGNDVLSGGAGDDTITGGAGRDLLNGGGGADDLDGGASTDALNGGAGDDDLDGGADRDSLYGGAGADDLDGGLGADLIVARDGEIDTIDEDEEDRVFSDVDDVLA